jgi:hypothetical protein
VANNVEAQLLAKRADGRGKCSAPPGKPRPLGRHRRALHDVSAFSPMAGDAAIGMWP